MEKLRDRLASRIEEALADMINQQLPVDTLLQIEASLILPQEPFRHVSRIVLDTIDINEIKQSLDGMRESDLNGGIGLAQYAVVTPANGRLPNTLAPILASAVPDVLYDDISVPTAILDQHGRVINGIHVSTRDVPPSNFNATSEKRKQLPVDKLVEGIWEQIHQSKNQAGERDLKEVSDFLKDELCDKPSFDVASKEVFERATRRCRRVTVGTRTARSLEVVIQAHWIDQFDTRLSEVKQEQPNLKLQEHKKIVMSEACEAFSWSEKELRNRTAVWKGYKEIKHAAGWAALVFAGSGIYRYCKYRQGFDDDAMQKLRCLRTRAEVAADAIQPQWREVLALVNGATAVIWAGHPHDWTVSLKEDEGPLPLPVTYKKWDANFTFEHLYWSRIDTEQWGDQDPRQFEFGPEYYCRSCTQRQSLAQDENSCECFPDIYGPNARSSCPVQIFRTENGKNNGLIACCAFDTGKAVGEFLGLITKGLADVDVMQSQAGDNEPYQIWQGRCGNFTRFINHSCASNCAFQTFSWLGVQRIVVVSKGVAAGEELTVDYSNHYWDNLDKICLCGEACCRFKDKRQPSTERNVS